VIRKTAFVPDTGMFFNMARSGHMILFGDGANRFNPIYEAYLASFCIAPVIFFSSASRQVYAPASVLASDVQHFLSSTERASAVPPKDSAEGRGGVR
jgi:hypothetical protein